MNASGVLVVGAGLAGLTAAAELRKAGVDTVVVDKGRAVGGRMATRTVGPARFDHGAQHFSARSDEFRARVGQWSADGIVREWFRSPSQTDPRRGTEPRHAVPGGMRRVPEHVAADLDVRTSVTVAAVERHRSGVVARTASGQTLEAAVAVLTPPVPQLLALVDAGDLEVPPPLRSTLTSIRYDACLAVMARLDVPSGLPDGHLTPDQGPIAWMADNQHKGTSAAPALTVHSTPAFAAAHLDTDPADWTATLCEAATPFLAGRVVAARGHRWRFAQPRTTLGDSAVRLDGSAPVVLAGEVFAGARVEGAFLSGLAAAQLVLES